MRGSLWAQTFALASVVFCSSAALAYPTLPDFITGAYPTATNLGTCGTCHNNFAGSGGLNPYGAAFLAADGLVDPASAIAAIENDDSDGDGTSNVTEFTTDAGFEPGWTCDTYGTAVNAPGNLADFVDTTNIGCAGGTTTIPPTTSTTVFVTTTLPATTTTVGGGTTTTTVPAPVCSVPFSGGQVPVASDCLFILRAAVGSSTCDPTCVCNTNGTGGITASDALLCLKDAVGQSVELNCQCGGTTTTTLGGTTTTLPTPTTTLGGGGTTTTLPTPTTTLGGGGTTTTLPTPTTTLGGGGTTTTLPTPTTTLGGGGTTTTLPTPTTTLGGGTTTTLGGGTTTTLGGGTTTTLGGATTTTLP